MDFPGNVCLCLVIYWPSSIDFQESVSEHLRRCLPKDSALIMVRPWMDALIDCWSGNVASVAGEGRMICEGLGQAPEEWAEILCLGYVERLFQTCRTVSMSMELLEPRVLLMKDFEVSSVSSTYLGRIGLEQLIIHLTKLEV